MVGPVIDHTAGCPIDGRIRDWQRRADHHSRQRKLCIARNIVWIVPADIVTVGTIVGAHLLRGEITEAELEPLVRDALDFPVPLVKVTDRVWALELFHGPTMAFKDVGARVQARLLHHFTDGTPLTILVATSGDTGSAVAQAFHRVPDTRVVVLYPAGKVSDVQEAQMASMGDNILAIAVDGTFDDCQRLVKTAFADDELRKHVWLTPANSINLGRLLPQERLAEVEDAEFFVERGR